MGATRAQWGNVCRVELPARLDATGVAGLRAILQRAEADPRVRVVVLQGATGAGVFCEGLDLSALTGEAAGAGALHAGVDDFTRCLHLLLRSSRVIIAAARGRAAGGGVGLLAAADLALCAEDVVLCLPELPLGLVPAMILPALLQRLPPRRALALALRPQLGAREALRCGLVDRLCAPDRLDRALTGAVKHALRCAPDGVRLLKQLADEMAAMDPGAALALGRRVSRERIADPRRQGLIRALLDGEPMPWFAREQRHDGSGAP